jgi:hypothetical protein
MTAQTAPSAPYAQTNPVGPRPQRAPYSYGNETGVEKKYAVLRTLAGLYKVLAFVVAGLYALLALLSLVAGASVPMGGMSGLGGGLLSAIFLLIMGGLAFIFFYALSELMYVFMDIEENTRKTNMMLSQRLRE